MSATPIRPLTVLIADSDRDQADTLSAALALHGFATRAAYSGMDAVVEQATAPADVVILDVLTLELDGWEVARRVRALPAPHRPLVVGLTGRPQFAWLSGGVVDLCFLKPVLPLDLVNLLERFRTLLEAAL